MPAFKEFEEKELISYRKYMIKVTRYGYLLVGPGLNELHIDILSAVEAFIEHIAQQEYIDKNEVGLDEYIEILTRVNNKVADRLETKLRLLEYMGDIREIDNS